MAIEYFWNNLRTAMSHYQPIAPQGADDPSTRNTRGWLTPQAVEGFVPNDFQFLEAEKQNALRDTIEQFRCVASKGVRVPQPPPGETEKGRDAFDRLLTILQPDRFWDAESFQIQSVLERELQGKLPAWVKGFFCETGLDLVDEPAVWIWVEVTDEAAKGGLVLKEALRFEEQITAAYRRTGGRRWPFVRFRSSSESPRSGGTR